MFRRQEPPKSWRSLAVGLALACLSAACGRSGALLPEESATGRIPLPWGVFPTAGPSPSATPPADVGDGGDGVLSGTGTNSTVNECQPITSASGTTVSLAAAFTTVAPGDRLLLLQVQDSLATASGDQADVDETAAGGAGRWEIATAAGGETSTSVDVAVALARTYGSGGGRAAQACRMPQYSSVSWSAGSIISPAWDGETGGVLAFFVRDTLSLTGATLTADGAGFRGGAAATGDGSGGSSDFDAADPDGAGKGEGVDGSVTSATGRGNVATGAGGGNARCAGGGGGGGWGSGGHGGSQTSDSGTSTTPRGLPGSRVVLPLGTRLLMGGGGGGPSAGSDGARGPGGSGGGIVLVVAQAIDITGTVSASGGNGQNGTGVDPGNGGSGGGAGGSIAVWALNGAISEVTVSGGRGGDATGTAFESGPGGGGGGGSTLLVGVTATTVDASGGGNGLTEQADPYGATPGLDGAVSSP